MTVNPSETDIMAVPLIILALIKLKSWFRFSRSFPTGSVQIALLDTYTMYIHIYYETLSLRARLVKHCAVLLDRLSSETVKLRA